MKCTICIKGKAEYIYDGDSFCKKCFIEFTGKERSFMKRLFGEKK